MTLDLPNEPPCSTPTSRLDRLASWSEWQAFHETSLTAPRQPGVYLARSGIHGPIVYVGMAGERNGRGLWGRLSVYRSGKAIASGLGEAVFDRAIADPEWVEARLVEARTGQSQRATAWGRLAFERADLYLSWTITADRPAARDLEKECFAALSDLHLWNRQR